MDFCSSLGYLCSYICQHQIVDDAIFDTEIQIIANFRSKKKKRGGSRPGKRWNVDRNHEEGFHRIWQDYFADKPTYSNKLFEHCDDNFIQKSDAAGKLGIHPTLKVIAASRILAYGISGNFVNDSLCISESTALECMKRFCTSVVRIFAEEYLRSPNEDDIERLLTENGQKGIPGMLGSTDCMHWYWDMCPVAYQGQYSGKSKKPSLVLEAIAWYDLWVWHAYFGTPGSQNDLNILDASTVIRNMGYPSKQKFKYTLNGNSYKQLYYLADGIYSSWTCFMKNYTRTH